MEYSIFDGRASCVSSREFLLHLRLFMARLEQTEVVEGDHTRAGRREERRCLSCIHVLGALYSFDAFTGTLNYHARCSLME